MAQQGRPHEFGLARAVRRGTDEGHSRPCCVEFDGTVTALHSWCRVYDITLHRERMTEASVKHINYLHAQPGVGRFPRGREVRCNCYGSRVLKMFLFSLRSMYYILLVNALCKVVGRPRTSYSIFSIKRLINACD